MSIAHVWVAYARIKGLYLYHPFAGQFNYNAGYEISKMEFSRKLVFFVPKCGQNLSYSS